ncbi:MAG: pyridoxal-phosphate dependent enzyme [Acidimicrobiaceae bacterium]|nr:pyridoxal-phosphate dependent enzyme [Acidimicrobiaceae bacterium]
MIREVLPPTDDQLDAARRVIADHLEETPSVTLSMRGRPVRAKLEGLQVTGSFKVRGALAAIDAAHRLEPDGAVITASAGNHGLGIAFASTTLDVRATVVVPANASAVKVKKLSQFDIELIQYGTSFDEAQAHALELADRRSIRFVSPFNDADVIAGQSTVFDEFFRQSPGLEHLVVSVGGGGLISGAILMRRALGLDSLRITGVQPEQSAALYHVLRGAKMSDVVHHPTIADGLAGGGDDGAVTNELIATSSTPLVLVPESEIRRGVREAAEYNGLVIEGSAAASYAAITNDLIGDQVSRVGFVVSGRNIAHDLFVTLLQEPFA